MPKSTPESFTMYPIKSEYLDGEFALFTSVYPNGTTAVLLADEEGEEVVSINLVAYDLIPPSGQFYVKSDAEMTGVADALVAAGIAAKISTVTYGPFGVRADLLRLIVTPSNGMPR